MLGLTASCTPRGTGARVHSGQRVAVRRVLIPLSALAVAMAVIGVSVPSAGAITKDVQLTIKTEPAFDQAIPPKQLRIDWETRCGKAESSGTQAFDRSVTHSCSRSELGFGFKLLAAHDDPFNEDSFSGRVLNPFFGRPDVKLERGGKTLFSPEDGYDENQQRNASVRGANGWDLHFRFRRDPDFPQFKRFTLWMWIAHP